MAALRQRASARIFALRRALLSGRSPGFAKSLSIGRKSLTVNIFFRKMILTDSQ
jgi:hypothetical protein